MVAKKTKSKRVTLQQKFKIKKRSKEHDKRMKKGRLITNYKKKNTDNFIPNAWPYKEELLQEIKVAREKMEATKQKQKETRVEEMMKRKLGITSITATTTNNVAEISTVHVIEDSEIKINVPHLGQNSRRAYLRELRKVVENADVILMVLDARDPIGTRSTAVEDMVLSNSKKKLVYVLNKSDLVPRDVLSGWLTYLRKIHPTVPFKCNTQAQKGNLGRATGKANHQNEGGLQTSQAVGAEELLGLLKNYCRIGDTKSIISVGCVGFPNVGKSSLINSLMRIRAVAVSSMPGFTKVTQEVILDKNIRLIDSPGIVFADGDSTATALRNCVNVEEMEDVMTPIQAILDRCPQPYLMQLYSISKFKANDIMSFLALVAKVTGKLKRGGVPNVDSAARCVIHDWNDGKIKYYCRPPVAAVVNGAAELDTKILSSFSEELDVGALREEDIRVLNALEAMQDADHNAYVGIDGIAGNMDFHIGDADNDDYSKPASKKRSKPSDMEVDDDNDDEDGGDDDDDAVTVASTKSKKSNNVNSSKSTKVSVKDTPLGFLPDEEAPTLDSRKKQKLMKKKADKDIRRNSRGSNNESKADFDFEADFKY